MQRQAMSRQEVGCGARDTFSRGVRRAYAPLWRYAQHRGLTGPDAEDLVAQVLEIAWRRIDDVPVAEPLPWPVQRRACRPPRARPRLLTPLSARAARELRARLPLTTPQCTVRWHTPGLVPAVAAQHERLPGQRTLPRTPHGME